MKRVIVESHVNSFEDIVTMEHKVCYNIEPVSEMAVDCFGNNEDDDVKMTNTFVVEMVQVIEVIDLSAVNELSFVKDKHLFVVKVNGLEIDVSNHVEN